MEGPSKSTSRQVNQQQTQETNVFQVSHGRLQSITAIISAWPNCLIVVTDRMKPLNWIGCFNDGNNDSISS